METSILHLHSPSYGGQAHRDSVLTAVTVWISHPTSFPTHLNPLELLSPVNTVLQEKQNHLKPNCCSKITLLSSSSLCLSEIPIHLTSQTCHREAIFSLCLSSASLLPSVIRTCPQTSPPSAVKAAPLTPVSPRSSPSSEPLHQASRDGCIGLARKSVQVMTTPLKEGPWVRGTNPWESFLCPLQGCVSPWTFYLLRLIICKKGTLKLSCASQLNTSRTEASMWEVVLKRLSPSYSFPTPACLIHHIKTVPSSKKASQVTYLLKDPLWLPAAFRQKSEHFVMR